MIEINPVTSAHALAAARYLIRAHIEAHSEAHNKSTTAALLAALPAPYVPPAGGLWVAWDGPEAAGCVALHPLTPDIAEVKRMYLRPASRGRGIARALAQRVVMEARELGYERLRRRANSTLLNASQARRVQPHAPTRFPHRNSLANDSP